MIDKKTSHTALFYETKQSLSGHKVEEIDEEPWIKGPWKG